MRLPFFRRRALVCRQAVALMTDYIEGALSGGDRSRLEAHLSGCPHCTEYLAQMRAVISVSGEVTSDALSDEALDDLVDLYRRWRDSA
jgi:anti-sigma factor RsiW